MAVTNDKAVTCPRCGEIARVEFKFCPACAYRLVTGAPEPVPAAERTSIWPHVLLLLGALTLIGGFVLAGMALFQEQPASTPPPSTPLTPAKDPVHHVRRFEAIAGDMVTIPGGVAEFRKEVDEFGPVYPDGATEPNVWPVMVSQLRMTRFEISRAQWNEFLEDIRERIDADPNVLVGYEGEFLRLLDPLGSLAEDFGIASAESGNWLDNMSRAPADAVFRVGTTLRWGEGYIDKWWQATANHLLLEHGTEMARPADLRLPLPNRWRLMMLVPPMWVFPDAQGRLDWAQPRGTGNLPVTGVSLFDAMAFAGWASEKLSMSLYVPTAAEFRLAYHGGQLPRQKWELTEEERQLSDPDLGNHFPWGSNPHFFLCNSLNTWFGIADEPRLLPVDKWFGSQGGLTEQSLYSMAGNAREWTRPQRYVLRPIRAASPEQPAQKDYYVQFTQNGSTATMGGSYLMGIDDCGVTKSQNEDVRARAVDLGFRLAMP